MLMIIRDWVATSKDLLPTVAAITMLIFIIGVFVFLAYAVFKAGSSAARGSNGQEQSSPFMEFGHLIIVTLGIVAVLVAFLVTMLFSADLFQRTAEVLAILTAVFGVIGTLVGTYFGIKASTDATQTAQQQTEAAQKQVQQLASGDSTSLAVVSSTPPRDVEDVEPRTPVTVTFSNDMDPSSIKGTAHFTLVRIDPAGVHIPVVGKVDYGPPDYGPRVAAFVPKEKKLDNGSIYHATITRGVRDLTGNALAADYTWQFKVRPEIPRV